MEGVGLGAQIRSGPTTGPDHEIDNDVDDDKQKSCNVFNVNIRISFRRIANIMIVASSLKLKMKREPVASEHLENGQVNRIGGFSMTPRRGAP